MTIMLIEPDGRLTLTVPDETTVSRKPNGSDAITFRPTGYHTRDGQEVYLPDTLQCDIYSCTVYGNSRLREYCTKRLNDGLMEWAKAHKHAIIWREDGEQSMGDDDRRPGRMMCQQRAFVVYAPGI